MDNKKRLENQIYSSTRLEHINSKPTAPLVLLHNSASIWTKQNKTKNTNAEQDEKIIKTD